MKIIIAIVLLSFVINFIVAQPTACSPPPQGIKFCEQCIAEGNGCGWCQAPTFGTCGSNFTCGFIADTTFISDPEQCTTCTVDEEIETDWCQLDHNSFQTDRIEACRTANSPEETSSTVGTVAATTQSCEFSDECILAAYALTCTFSCSLCDVENPDSIGNFLYCQPQCDDYNDVACVDEIEAGCTTALAETSCTEDEATCNPRIDATDEALSGNTGPATTAVVTTAAEATTAASTAATVATTAASTASTAATVATTAATTVTGQATSLASTAGGGTTRRPSGASMATLCAALFAFILFALL